MFNFNTQKKQSAPTMNSAAPKGGYSQQTDTNAMNITSAAEPSTNPSQEEYINNRLAEIEAQRREFVQKKPDFNLQAELQNSDFAKYLMKNELSVEDAYLLAHRDEIIDAAVKDALARISARRNRITENGAGKNSPAVVKKNPKDMSDKEIDLIIERVNNGEKISF